MTSSARLITPGAVERSVNAPGAPVQQAMDQIALHAMSPPEVGQLFASKGYADYGHLFQEHNITGARLLLLSPDDLREMGIEKVGDRLGIQQELQAMKTVARQVWRSKVIEEVEEVYPHNLCHYGVHTCCGLCPPQMDRYRLTSTMLKITHTHSPTICGRKCPCLGVRVENDMHPLNQIVDVDTTNMQDGCCAVPMTQISVHLTMMSQGDSVGERQTQESGRIFKPTAEMMVPFSVGETFAAKIRNQIEESKRNPSFTAH